ncbi:MAG: class I SAM-dependent methyltransferase [Armatimonadota bacterium]
MTEPHENVVTQLVRAWMHKGDQDLKTSRVLLEQEASLVEPIGFHLQQAIEKYLKAFLTASGVHPPRTHDLTDLLQIVGKHDPALAQAGEPARILDPYAVIARYPEETPLPQTVDMPTALDHVERVRRLVAARVSTRAAGGPLAYVITTSRRTDAELTERARRWAARLGRPLVERSDRSIARVCEDEGVEAVLTVTSERVGLVFPADDVEYFFHPSMARTRIRNIKEGFGDPMVAAMALEPGDSVLDCTLGRATDATVASWAVGEEGRVVGYEANPLLAALTIDGLAQYEIDGAGVQEAMRRIEAHQGDCRELLPTMDTCSFDVVYFDPFFGQMLQKSQAMKPLRRIGLHEPIGRETYEEARRVASRSVVIKQRRGEELPHVPEPDRAVSGGGSRVEYLVLQPGS